MYIIDTIAPFFLSNCFAPGQTVNWSKVPFALLEQNGIVPLSSCDQIVRRFDAYLERVAPLGFNAISIDDCAHLVTLRDYSGALVKKINRYVDLYRRLFACAKNRSLQIFINSDIMFFPAGATVSLHEAVRTMTIALRRLFEEHECVSGVIIRFGECDGMDVSGELLSRLVVRNPPQARELIGRLVAVCEEFNRLLIVRTWTVGAYPIGDMIWNPHTFHAAFSGIESDRLIVSHYYGNSDFYRFLTLNPLIFEGPHQKIVEFQARREYEGFGEFPAFVGEQYEHYRDQLLRCKNLAGIHVWCQTGGWGRFNKLSFMPGSSLWNEINATVTIDLFRRGCSAQDSVSALSKKRFPQKDPGTLIRLLENSEMIINQL